MNNVKITKISIIIFLTFICITCKKEPSENFPYAQVSLSINLITNPIGIGTAIGCPNSANLCTIGAAGKGILIYNSDGITYIAYAALCTNFPKDTSAVELNSTLGGDEAQCPKCKSRFLLTDGSVLNGPAKYPLKQYSVSDYNDGTSLLIQN